MPPDLLRPSEVDARMTWPPGRAEQLARQTRIPHYLLPDGSIRLSWGEVSSLVRRVNTPAITASAKRTADAR